MEPDAVQIRKKARARYGSGSVFKQAGSRRFYISLSVDGVQKTRSTGTEDRKVAQALLEDWKSSISRGEPDPFRAAKTTCGQLLDLVEIDYAAEQRHSIDDVKSRIKNHLRPWFGERRAADLTNADVQQYLTERRKTGVAAATLANEVSILKRALTLGMRENLLTRKPVIQQVRVGDNSRKGFLTPTEFRRFVSLLPDSVAVLATIAYQTGCRRGELQNLAWNRLDLDAGMIRLRPEDTKNGEARNVPLTAEAVEMLRARKRLRAEKGSDIGLVFFREEAERLVPLGDFRTDWERAAAAIGKTGLLLHDFRRSFCKNAIDAGLPQTVIMACSGHKTVSVFHRYSIVDESNLRKLVDKVEEYSNSFGRPPETETLTEGPSVRVN